MSGESCHWNAGPDPECGLLLILKEEVELRIPADFKKEVRERVQIQISNMVSSTRTLQLRIMFNKSSTSVVKVFLFFLYECYREFHEFFPLRYWWRIDVIAG